MEKTYNVALVAINNDAPESAPISEPHWELPLVELQKANVAFIARVYGQVGHGNVTFFVEPLAD